MGWGGGKFVDGLFPPLAYHALFFFLDWNKIHSIDEIS